MKSIPQRDTGPSLGCPPYRRLCCRCQTDQPVKGGKTASGMFTCALCRAPKGPIA